jgi:DeoR family transcriptional regulator of aga operon
MSSTEHHVPPEVRQARIRALLGTQEFVRVADLATTFGTSEVTIRNDLVSLEASGHLRRVHGGAVPRIVHRVEQPYDDTHPDAVLRHTPIGERAAALVQPGDTLIIDVGTTTTAVARALVAREDLSDVVIFTNGLKIALELERAHPRFTIVVTGGTVRPLQHSLVNPLGDVLLGSIKANLAIIGCNGVDVTGGITNVNLPEAEIKARMLAAVRRRVVVADSSKLGQVELARVCPIGDIDVLVTDGEADATQVEGLRGAGLEVLVA